MQKVKCGRELPYCKRCITSNVLCEYKSLRPPKAPAFRSLVRSMVNRLDILEDTLTGNHDDKPLFGAIGSVADCESNATIPQNTTALSTTRLAFLEGLRIQHTVSLPDLTMQYKYVSDQISHKRDKMRRASSSSTAFSNTYALTMIPSSMDATSFPVSHNTNHTPMPFQVASESNHQKREDSLSMGLTSQSQFINSVPHYTHDRSAYGTYDMGMLSSQNITSEQEIANICERIMPLDAARIARGAEKSPFLACALNSAQAWQTHQVDFALKHELAERKYALTCAKLDQDTLVEASTVIGILWLFEYCMEMIGYAHLRLARSTAVALKLHIYNSTLDEVESEFRCRLWWACYLCEVAYAAHTTSSRAIFGEYISSSQPLPLSIDNLPWASSSSLAISNSHPNGWDNTSLPQKTAHRITGRSIINLSYLQRSVMACKDWYTPGIPNQTTLGYRLLLFKILENVVEYVILFKRQGADMLDHQHLSLCASLHSWIASLPHGYDGKIPTHSFPNVYDYWHVTRILINNLLYHHVTLRLHRPMLCQLLRSRIAPFQMLAEPAYIESVRSAVESTSLIHQIFLYKSATKQTMLYLHMPVLLCRQYIIYSASLFGVMLHVMRDHIQVQDTMAHLNIHMSALSRLVSRSSDALAQTNMLRRMADLSSDPLLPEQLADILPQ
ncbi:hypothetical protein BSLG_007914 [Batrachochytrium salamandrivorans]|nr:hypothetical protein BSLG_007914 [Batrachochytrium salamandrivorans]